MGFLDIFKVTFLLTSMPDSYDNTVVELDARNEAELTHNLVRLKFSDEFLKRSERTTGWNEQLMLSKNSGRGFFQSDTDHLKLNCPKHFGSVQTKTAKKGYFGGSDQKNKAEMIIEQIQVYMKIIITFQYY